MYRDEFIESATLNALPGPLQLRDTIETRVELADRFQRIQNCISCEHVIGESFLVADAILRLQVPGPVIECGCFRGGFTTKLSLVCALTGRDLFVFDSFMGLPHPHLFDGNYRFYTQRVDVQSYFGGVSQQFRRGDYYASLAEVRRNVAFQGNRACCTFVPGWFSETLRGYTGSAALVLMDVDLIESARDCLRHLWPRLTGPSFFTHEAIHETYMEGILDAQWWQETLGCGPPETDGVATGLHPAADCLAALRRRPTNPQATTAVP